MKLKLVLVFIALICTCKIGGQEKTIIIKNDTVLNESKSDISNHRDKDIEIVKVKIDSNEVYMVILYREEDGKLNDNTRLGFDSKNVYDKATYEWIDDITLKFKVFNSKNGVSESFIQIGFGEMASQLKREDIK
jgi:hypothetical protein